MTTVDSRIQSRGPTYLRAFLSFAFLAVSFAGCGLDEGKGFNPGDDDPVIIVDPTAVQTSVEVFPPNLVADGETHGTIAARILLDGQPVPGIPVLFYSEWGELFTACSGSQVPGISAFANGLITNSEGFASTLLNAPVLPNLFNDNNESNTIAAYFLVNGQVFTAYTTQVLYKVELSRVQCKFSNGTATVTATYSGRGTTLPVSACQSVQWSAVSQGAGVSSATLCSTNGNTTATVRLPTTGSRVATVQISATFSGAGLNECVLDEDRVLELTNFINVGRDGQGRNVCDVR